MQMKHSAKEIRAKATSKANAIVKMNENNGEIQSLAMAMSREEKCRQKRNLAKQQKKTMRNINYAAAVLRHPP